LLAWVLLAFFFVFFLFIHYSRATYGDHGENMYSPFPVRSPRSGGSLQAPLLPSAQAGAAGVVWRGLVLLAIAREKWAILDKSRLLGMYSSIAFDLLDHGDVHTPFPVH